MDSTGIPTSDPVSALSGAMLTFGGHKGSASAAMVELLAGALINDHFLIANEGFREDRDRLALCYLRRSCVPQFYLASLRIITPLAIGTYRFSVFYVLGPEGKIRIWC